jgi:DnaK suppressor protein
MDDEALLLVQRYRPRVEEMLRDLLDLQQQTEGDRAPVALDQQSVGRVSRIDALQGQAMAAASDRRRTVTIARLRRALVRMEEGEFGFCTECGERISDGRLDADPSSHTCINCAALAGGR